MSKAFTIEVGSTTAGLVVQDGRYFQFFASEHEFHELEGRTFRSVADANRIIRAHREDRLQKTQRKRLAA